MLVAVYNRTFETRNIPQLQKVLKTLHEQQIQMVFFKDFYERFLPYFNFEYIPILFSCRKDLP
jgi:hypothetical protein